MNNHAKEPIILRSKKLKNGVQSLYLDLWNQGRHEYDFLKLYLVPEITRGDKERNRRTLALANAIKAKRIVDYQNGIRGFKQSRGKTIRLIDYFEQKIKKRKLAGQSCSNISSCLYHIKQYERRNDITLSEITSRWITGFKKYLEMPCGCKVSVKNSRKNNAYLSPSSRAIYFAVLRSVLNSAYSDGLIEENPMNGLKGLPLKIERAREYLTIEELRTLADTPCDVPEVRRAFLFSCLTGLRRSDIEKLSWHEVTSFEGKMRLVFQQKKTGGVEYLDITDQAAALIRERPKGTPFQAVFSRFLTPPNTNKVLQSWAEKAGIKKHITFHVARHTFATLMLTLGTDLYTVSKLLGHREIRTTQIYAEIVDEKKRAAIEAIPEIL